MNITDKNTLKSWFLRGMKPLETQFAAWIDAYWHKSEQIPTSSINGLESTLNSKAETTDLQAHRNDRANPHQVDKTQVGLSNADNTADANKPLSFPQREAMDEMRNDLETKINKHIKNVAYDTATATFTFTFEDDTTAEIDTPIEHAVKSGHFDPVANELILVLISGEEIHIPAARLAFKDSVNLSATTSATTLTISNDCGTSAVIPAATTTTAGAMTATDRTKMTQLFDGTMLDSRNPQGYHRHNYLEMQDLPPIVSLPAASYQEFKNAILKLQPEITKGKYGEIVQTGDWTITDDILHDVTGISLARQTGFVFVNQKPLKLLNRTSVLNLFDLYFQGGNFSDPNGSIQSLYIKTTVSIDIFLNNLTFMAANGTHIEIDNGSVNANTYIDKIRNYAGESIPTKPIIIKYKNNVNTTVSCINISSSVNKNIEVIASTSKEILLYTDCSCEFINPPQRSKIGVLQSNFTGKNPAGLVPTPATAQKTQYHILNALGEWVDIRTLTSGI